MFDLAENQRDFYYQTYKGLVEEVDDDDYFTGNKIPSYSSPIKARAMISENTSDAVQSPFGKDLVYDRLISTVQDLPIDEYSKLFIDVVPVLNEDGTTDTLPDYEVIRVSKGIYQRVWAVRKVEGYGNKG